jgi:hypothetical protein
MHKKGSVRESRASETHGLSGMKYRMPKGRREGSRCRFPRKKRKKLLDWEVPGPEL